MNKKHAFTLAEVLITLGIIGVVAAMTLPTVINNTQNRENQVQLQKTYSELNQISRLFMEHNGVSVPKYINQNGMSAFLNEFPKYVKEIYNSSDWTFNDQEDDKTNLPYDIYTLSGNEISSFACDTQGFRIDILGREISFDDAPKAGYNGPRICVDVNGKNKPNVFGIDIFTFQFTTDGFVIPEGQDHKDNNYNAVANGGGTVLAQAQYCGKTLRANWMSGITCAYYALLDKNPQGNGTYWKDFIGRKLYK